MSRIVIVGLTILPPSMSRLSRQCVILNISQPYRPPQPVTGQLYFFFLLYFSLNRICSGALETDLSSSEVIYMEQEIKVSLQIHVG
jgi:hypothetical protein